MASPRSELPRRIGIFTAGCLLVSTVVGSGIFTTTGFMARDLGDPWLILAISSEPCWPSRERCHTAS